MLSTRSSTKRILQLAALAITVAASFALTSGAQAQSYLPGDEAKSIALVNSARSAAGLGTLTKNSGLDSVARAQAARMAARDGIYHNPSLKADADAAGVNWQWIGENVGVGPDVPAVHDAFMASPGHHANIVYASYNAIGVGVVKGSDGSVFVAHVFAGVQAAAPAPAAVKPVAPKPAPQAAAPAAAPVASVTPQAQPSAPVAAAPVVADAAPKVTTPVTPLPNAVVGGIVTHELVI
jgi:uncharacterized protein YkwD